MFEQRTDEQLAAAYLAGDKSAFDILVERYQERLINFVRGKINNYQDAQDVVQDTWLRVWKRLPDFDDTRKFSSLLYKICNGEIFRKLGERGRQRFTNFSQLPDDIKKLKAGPIQELADGLVARDRILAILNHEEHRLWDLVVTKGRAYESIAQDEKLFHGKTVDELREKFAEVMRKVWEQRNKEVAKWKK